MEPTPAATPQPPVPPPGVVLMQSEQRRLPQILAVVALLVILALGAGVILKYTKKDQGEEGLLLAVGAGRIAPLYRISKQEATPVTQLVSGEARAVYDQVIRADGARIVAVASSPDSTGTDLVLVMLDGSATALTATPTSKTNLTLDPSGRYVAFEEAPATALTDAPDPSRIQIAELDLETQAVRVIGNGVHPRYTNAGTLLAGTPEGIVLFTPRTSTVTPVPSTVLLAPRIYSYFDVNAAGTHFVAYNMVTRSIDTFTFGEGGLLSYQSSVKADDDLQNLAVDDAGIASSVGSTATPEGSVVTITRFTNPVMTETRATNINLSVQRIEYAQ